MSGSYAAVLHAGPAPRRPARWLLRCVALVVLAFSVVLMHSGPAQAGGCGDVGAPTATSAAHTTSMRTMAAQTASASDSGNAVDATGAPVHRGPRTAMTGHSCMATPDADGASMIVADGVAVRPCCTHRRHVMCGVVEARTGVPGRAPDLVRELSVQRV